MRYDMPAVDECEGGAASAAGMIAMIGAGAIQTPRGRPMAANVDKFPRSGRKPLRGAFIWLLEANAVHGVGNGLWRPTWTGFHVYRKSRSEWRLFGP